jgi:RNA polymerase sigma-70 factor (ECF subfamily)
VQNDSPPQRRQQDRPAKLKRDEPSDRDLLARIAARDGEAMRMLYYRYYRRVARFLARITRRGELVEEIVNDTFMVIWTKARDFRGDSQVSTWIHGIAYRRGLAVVDTESRAERDMRSAFAEAVESDDNSSEQVELADWMEHALHQLPIEQRAALELAYYVGLTCEEIGEVMQSPTNTIKTRMLHARRKLRAAFDAHSGETPVIVPRG